MTSTYLYTKLNQFFVRDADIFGVIRYLNNGTYPNNVDNDNAKSKFRKKFKKFKVVNNKLVYEPKNLIVIPKRSVDKTLKNEYKNNFGSGIVNFYKTIRSKYLNIKRIDVEEFIKRQVNNQLIGNFKHRINKPIVALYPNQLWCIDLIDIKTYSTKNKNYSYIVNIVDVFSRKVWLEPLKTKSSITTKNALNRIIQRADVKPKYLISDNGGEFEKHFKSYCEENNIQQRFNRAYSPQANGIVEAKNKQVRKLIKNVFIQHRNNVWINDIKTIENILNDTYTSAIKNIPNKIWTNTNQPNEPVELFNRDPLQQEQYEAHMEIKKNVKKKIAEFKDQEFNVGDSVRLRLDEIFKNIKDKVKKQDTKDLIIAYSPSIFTIDKKIIPRKGLLERSRYILRANNGKLLLTKEGGKPRQVYGNVLLKVNDDDFVDISNEQAMKINGVKANENDATT